ncbi:hypothetical protein [Paenibacillus sp. PvR098]|uniref:hypothetical protein n=1 Tax=unclassified Paenibacillus TaxID=185978 RepID=UPI0032AF75D8
MNEETLINAIWRKTILEEVSIGLLSIKVVIGFITLFFIIIVTGRTSILQLTPFHLIFVLVLGDFLRNTIYEDEIGVFYFIRDRIMDGSHVGRRVFNPKDEIGSFPAGCQSFHYYSRWSH